ncbi:MAG: 5'/3'-nucleotidase SurE [Acidimicrobiales bacterium]|nr:5'/3'-nucleotidase SurE [Acidimicrobiales bacterium]HRW39412.1 5'/3'-nucleotidase SurE [Aquihabitans sp.]
MGNPRHRSVRRGALVALALLLPLAACSSDGGSDASSPEPTADATTTSAAPAAPLAILVSNDDGYDAEGIDALVEGLATLDDVEITVVAPATQQSGTGGSETEGDLSGEDVELRSGHPATAVEGFPADSVRYAFETMGVEPDLVVTGINEGQNLGPIVDASGTVGAARKAVSFGVPALATSQGFGDELDYDVAVPLILDWVTEHREALAAGDAPVEVTNLNVPSCDEGELRGLLEVETDVDGDGPAALGAADCTSTVAESALEGDIDAFLAGFATIDVVAATPGG